ncbi:MAG: c-type cytochrome [Pseudomonadota bacterium]
MNNLFGLMLVAMIALAGCDNTDEHQDVADKVKQAYDKSAKPMPVGNAEAGKVIAGRCARCHGMDGVLARMGAPFIAGVAQDYMVSAMLAYADGLRKNEQMKLIVNELKLKPELIANVSAYYASLKTPWKGANVGNAPDSTVSLSQDAIEAGSAIASGCNQCHGGKSNGTGYQSTPVLAAMTPEYFIHALKSYFNGKRNHGVMKIFGSSIKESEIKQLAAYYAVQPPIQMSLPGKGDAKAGEHETGMCAGCHSIDGNALNPNFPSLAGQPAEYLIKAMKDYRDGRRDDPMMADVMRNIQDETIVNLAAYYANQHLESPLQMARMDYSKFDPVAEGARIAGSCGGCHGKNGNSVKTGIPSLTGLNVKYLVSATRDYRDGLRKNKVMKNMVATLSDTDIEKVAFYYATQSPVAGKTAPKADLAAGEKISSGCTSCHGEGGVSTTPGTPSLAGQDAGYLAAATRDYARGVRSNETMSGPARGLKPKDIASVAGYFASLKAVKPDTALPLPPQLSIARKCSRCHGESGRSSIPGIPSLAGQSETYLLLAIKEYQDGTRKQHTMNAMSDVLSLVEMKAIAAYYARQ